VKVLCVDHGAFLRAYRQRYVAMAADPDVQVIVVAPRRLSQINYAGQGDARDESESGYQLEFCGFRPAKAHRGLFDPFRLTRVIRQTKPDIIHTQGEPEALSSGELGLLRAAVANRARFVFSSWANINVYRLGWPYRGSRLYDVTYRHTLRHAEAATTYNAEAERVLRENGFMGRIRSIPWGVDSAVFRPLASDEHRARLGLRGFVVGYVGRMEEGKGVPTLIRGLAQTGIEATLLLIGEGPLREAWSQLAAELNVSTQVVGRVANVDMPTHLNCLDVLVLPSETQALWAEQFGKVLVEAMACGVPVVGSDSGEIPNVIGEAGLVFRQGSAEELASALRALATVDGLRRELARRGRERANDRYSWASVAQQTLAFYRELL
jgi:glycosyltransferase involved in cell wall biosynthesis